MVCQNLHHKAAGFLKLPAGQAGSDHVHNSLHMKIMLIIPKMPVELLTKDDLETFRKALLSDIKLLLSTQIPEPHEWLRCSDVRRMLKISTGTVQNLRISGQLKSQKVGGIHYYKLADIENMISSKIK